MKYVSLFLMVLICFSCGKNKFKRSDFLQNFYTQKILSDLEDTENELFFLSEVVDGFNLNPDADHLELIRTSFKTTLQQFEKIAFYNLGDISAISVYNAAYKTSIDSAEIWNNYDVSPSFTADLVSAYGNKEKGIYTIEYLLYFEHAADSVGSAKYRSYLTAHVETLSENFDQIKTSWATYETNFVSKSDEGVEGSYNIVINRIIHLLEDLIDKRINMPLDASDVNLAVGHWSSSAWQSIKTQVEQLRAIYIGKGSFEEPFHSVYNSVHKKNRKLADEIKDQFDNLIEQGDAMTQEMDTYLTTETAALINYKEGLKNLLVLFKLDVVEELDIVLTFGDNDGD